MLRNRFWEYHELIAAALYHRQVVVPVFFFGNDPGLAQPLVHASVPGGLFVFFDDVSDHLAQPIIRVVEDIRRIPEAQVRIGHAKLQDDSVMSGLQIVAQKVYSLPAGGHGIASVGYGTSKPFAYPFRIAVPEAFPNSQRDTVTDGEKIVNLDHCPQTDQHRYFSTAFGTLYLCAAVFSLSR